MGKTILITSGKGGTGKTTCCAAIGSFLAAGGHRTLCVDCDTALRNLDLVLGLFDRTLWDFSDILAGNVTARDAIVAHPDIEGLSFLSAPAGVLPGEIDRDAFDGLIKALSEDFDYILLDSPAGIGSGFDLAASAADAAIIVSTGDSSSLRDGQRTAEELRARGVEDLRLLVNRVKPRLLRLTRRTVDDMIDGIGVQLLGLVSEDESVTLSGSLETPLLLYGARYAYDQFSRIARRIAGEKVPLGRV